MTIEPPRPDPAADKAGTIFARRPLHGEAPEAGPLLVVGLPRSGSSTLADLISQTGAAYCFDDLYFQRHAERIGARGPLDRARLDDALHFLGWQIRARLRWKRYALPRMEEADVEPMNDAIRAAFAERPPDWQTLQKEWLWRLARLNGCRNWGYNQPGAFLGLDELLRIYPKARVAFLFRAPERVLASFKHMPDGHRDGDPRQYHPLAYALYWRKSAEAYERWRQALPGRTIRVRFEEMVEDPRETAVRLAAFLGETFDGPVRSAEANTSFRGGRRALTGLETALLRRVAGPAAQRVGYRIDPEPVRAGDFWDLPATTARFGLYQMRRLRGDQGRLRQVRRLLGRGAASDA